MAGNVREWCWNETGDQRVIMGGGWNDPDYMALRTIYSQPPMDRSITNGIRLARYEDADSILARARQPIAPRPPVDYLAIPPVPDDVFAVYRRMFDYDRIPLKARVERADTTPHWVRERITFDASYGGERMVLYLYLPRSRPAQLQTVVYLPGAGALSQRSIDQWRTIHLDYIVKSGRAFAFPVFLGTFERPTERRTDGPAATAEYRESVLRWSQDLRRSIDYLVTRADIDSSRFAYYGYSWGGRLGPLMLVTEPRLKTGILYVAGIDARRPMPEVDEISYAPRVRVPVLMINGKLDQVFPLETSAKPFFQLLGTPPAHKHLSIAEGGHFVPRPQLIRETLDWLDRYLGPVR
jgi:dienelactone hydrolase